MFTKFITFLTSAIILRKILKYGAIILGLKYVESKVISHTSLFSPVKPIYTLLFLFIFLLTPVIIGFIVIKKESSKLNLLGIILSVILTLIFMFILLHPSFNGLLSIFLFFISIGIFVSYALLIFYLIDKLLEKDF